MEQGADVWQSMAKLGLLSAPEVRVLETAERVGNRPWVLHQLALLKKRRTMRRLAHWSELALPLVIVLMGAFVLFQALGVFSSLDPHGLFTAVIDDDWQVTFEFETSTGLHGRTTAEAQATLDLLVAFTLLVTVISVATPLVVRHGRLLKSHRNYRLALDELSNQLDRLTALPLDELPGAIEQLTPSPFLTERLPGARLSGELQPVESGTARHAQALLERNGASSRTGVPRRLGVSSRARARRRADGGGTPMKTRRAISLLELLVIMSASTVVLTLTGVLLHRAMRIQMQSRAHVDAERTCTAPRQSVPPRCSPARAASQRQCQRRKDIFLRLEFADGRTAEYSRSRRHRTAAGVGRRQAGRGARSLRFRP